MSRSIRTDGREEKWPLEGGRAINQWKNSAGKIKNLSFFIHLKDQRGMQTTLWL